MVTKTTFKKEVSDVKVQKLQTEEVVSRKACRKILFYECAE